MKKIPLYGQMALGILASFVWYGLHQAMAWEMDATLPIIQLIGSSFLNSLKALTMPLMITSLIVGVSNLESTARLSSLGAKALLAYMVTTIFAVSLGLLIGNIVQPGHLMTSSVRELLMAIHSSDEVAILSSTPSDLVPGNLFAAMTNNTLLFPMVIFSLLFGIALLHIPARKREHVVMVMDGCNEALIVMVGMVMRLAPLGMFALIVPLLACLDTPSNIADYLHSVMGYFLATCAALCIMTFVVYPLLLSFGKRAPRRFLKAMWPAQLVAFSTRSSAATLPVTIRCVEQGLKIPKAISRFSLTLGSQVNMDGSAIYQGITIMFIAQAFQIDLTLLQQLKVIAWVTLSSIGISGVPGASMGSTATLLQALGIDSMGINLVSLTSGLLDMLRTVTNITGDGMVAVLLHDSEQQQMVEEKGKAIANHF